MSAFCEAAWAATAELQAAIVDHPFNRALADGTLDRQRFTWYLVQDARYLRAFSGTLAQAGRQAADPGDAAFFATSAERALVVEGALHAGELARAGLAGDPAHVPTGDACRAYTAFLAEAAAGGSFPVTVAAVLPCFWIYQVVGTDILGRTADRPDHPYRAWIDTYADEAFAAEVDRVRAIADRHAAVADDGTVGAMHGAFARASQLEWAFWEDAWQAGGSAWGSRGWGRSASGPPADGPA